MPTLAELRAQTGPKPLPKASRTVTLVEGQHLVDESRRLAEELADILAAAERVDEDGNPVGPPPKIGADASATRLRSERIEQIGAEQKALVGRLAEFQGIVGLRGVEGGAWQQFKNENPPREDSREDDRLAGGYCNFSAVFDSLSSYVATWDGEEIPEGEWDNMLASRIIYADRRDLAHDVVEMHEQGMSRAPKSPSSSSSTDPSVTD